MELGNFKETSHSEASLKVASDKLNIDPDKLIDAKDSPSFTDTSAKSFDPDKLIEPTSKTKDTFSSEPTPESIENLNSKSASDVGKLESNDSGESLEKTPLQNFKETGFYTSLKERIDRTPKQGWDGARGESMCRIDDPRVNSELAKYGQDGIEYKNGQPDFSHVSESSVTIDNMSEKRLGSGGNYEQADEACAEKWNAEKRDGKTDWSADDVADYREDNQLTWHERPDMKTCDLVPRCIHQAFTHSGGVCECKKRDNVTGGFDNA